MTLFAGEPGADAAKALDGHGRVEGEQPVHESQVGIGRP
jgi:hypothetical protein